MTESLGFEWNMLDQIKLRECEIRLRNADVLRGVLVEQLLPFAERHVLQPWPQVRAQAIEIMTAAQTCLDEYTSILADVGSVVIPANERAAEDRRKAVATEATTALETVKPILTNIQIVIDGEDARGITPAAS